MLVGEPLSFTLEIANQTSQTVVLYFPRSWIALDTNFGTLNLQVRENESGLGIGCPGTTEFPRDAFAPGNFNEVPSHTECVWVASLVWDDLYCPPKKLPGPGKYTMWYRYENAMVGLEATPFGDPTTEWKFYDVGALLGAKHSNKVEFAIVEGSEDT